MRGALERAMPGLLAAAALFFALLGQRLFTGIENVELLRENPAPLRDGLLLFGLAALVLWMARRALPTTPGVAPEEPPTLLELPAPEGRMRWGISGVGVALAALLLLVLARESPAGAAGRDYTGHFVAWLLSWGLIVGAWLWPDTRPRRLATRLAGWLRTNAVELGLVGALTLLAGWLRLNGLATDPAILNGDEASIGLEVRRILDGELRHPFITMWGAHGTLVGMVQAASARLFGFGIGALRLPGAIAGTLAIPALYLLGRQIAPRRIAAGGALLLATLPVHIHYSRALMNVSWDSLSYPLTGALLLAALRAERGSRMLFALGGLAAGLGQYPYTGSRLLLVLVTLFLVVLAATGRGERLGERLDGIGLFYLVAGVVAAPFFLYGLQFPDLFNERINQVGILQNGWLLAEATSRGESPLLILWDQFRRALLGFAFYPDRSEGWNAGVPLVGPLVSAGLFFALALGLRRWREPGALWLQLWFWLVILSAGMLTVAPPNSNRLSVAIPAVTLLAATGLDAIARAIARGWPRARRAEVSRTLLVGALAAAALLGVWGDQRYRASQRFGGPSARIATSIGRSLAAAPPETTLVMIGAPRLYSGVSPILFLAPGRTTTDLIEPLTAPPSALPDPPLLITVLPERAGEMVHLFEMYPDAALREVSGSGGELLYYELHVDG